VSSRKNRVHLDSPWQMQPRRWCSVVTNLLTGRLLQPWIFASNLLNELRFSWTLRSKHIGGQANTCSRQEFCMPTIESSTATFTAASMFAASACPDSSERRIGPCHPAATPITPPSLYRDPACLQSQCQEAPAGGRSRSPLSRHRGSRHRAGIDPGTIHFRQVPGQRRC
jgi:hypothetical protein